MAWKAAGLAHGLHGVDHHALDAVALDVQKVNGMPGVAPTL
jgi:hypothetical protein